MLVYHQGSYPGVYSFDVRSYDMPDQPYLASHFPIDSAMIQPASVWFPPALSASASGTRTNDHVSSAVFLGYLSGVCRFVALPVVGVSVEGDIYDTGDQGQPCDVIDRNCGLERASRLEFALGTVVVLEVGSSLR